jgi:phosphate transport system permease protein
VAIAVLWMMAFLVLEAWPLTRPAVVTEARVIELPGVRPGPVLCDEYRSVVVLLGEDGLLRVRSLRGDSVSTRAPRTITLAPAFVRQTGTPEQPLFVVGTRDGRLGLVPVRFRIEFTEEGRRVTPEIRDTIWLEMDPAAAPLRLADAWIDASDSAVGAALLSDGALVVLRRSVRRNLLTGAETVRQTRSEISAPGDLTALVLGPRGGSLFGGASSGALYWWSLGADPASPIVQEQTEAPIRTLTFLLGGRSLVAGLENGRVEVWYPLGGEGGERRLVRVRKLEGDTAPIVEVAPSMRNRSFLALDASGGAALHYSTTGRTLWRGELGTGPLTFAYFAPRGDGALVWGKGGLRELEIGNNCWDALRRGLVRKPRRTGVRLAVEQRRR